MLYIFSVYFDEFSNYVPNMKAFTLDFYQIFYHKVSVNTKLLSKSLWKTSAA